MYDSKEKNILFIDQKGNIRKKVYIGGKSYAFAKSGRAAVVADWDDKANILTITYYDEEGNEIWKKKETLNNFTRVFISNNGETIGIQEGNPHWSEEEWKVGEINISRIVFIDRKGNRLYEYKGFRNIGWGEFSGDGKYYAGLFWWQEGMEVSGKLIYINIYEGKIIWEASFGGNWWKWGEQFGDDNYLAISEKGSYVAAVDLVPAEKAPQGVDNFDYFIIIVFDQNGEIVSRIKDTWVYRVTEDGLIFTGGRIIKQLADIKMPKVLLRSKGYKPKTALIPVTGFPNTKSRKIIEHDELIDDINFEKYLVHSIMVREGKLIDIFENFERDLLLKKQAQGVGDFTLDGKYFKTFWGNRDSFSFYKIR